MLTSRLKGSRETDLKILLYLVSKEDQQSAWDYLNILLGASLIHASHANNYLYKGGREGEGEGLTHRVSVLLDADELTFSEPLPRCIALR